MVGQYFSRASVRCPFSIVTTCYQYGKLAGSAFQVMEAEQFPAAYTDCFCIYAYEVFIFHLFQQSLIML